MRQDSDAAIWRFPRLTVDESCLLRAPLTRGPAMDRILSERCTELERIVGRLNLKSAQDALLILRAAYGSPKILNVLRSAPCVDHPALTRFDTLLRDAISSITNCALDEVAWVQASLPIRVGGLGIRSVVMLASSAFLASAAATSDLQKTILGENWMTPDSVISTVLQVHWCNEFNAPPPEGSLAKKQKEWDSPAVAKAAKMAVHGSCSRPNWSSSTFGSGSTTCERLNALPVASCGLRLDDESIRVAIGLRLGSKICEPHECSWGAIVDIYGTHGLSCKYGPGRITRHHLLNELLCKALCSSGIPAIKEPTGLVRDDGKRPDDLTLVPWFAGKSLTWDVTVADTLAQANLPQTVHRSGAAAEADAERKIRKYASIAMKHMFVPPSDAQGGWKWEIFSKNSDGKAKIQEDGIHPPWASKGGFLPWASEG